MSRFVASSGGKSKPSFSPFAQAMNGCLREMSTPVRNRNGTCGLDVANCSNTNQSRSARTQSQAAAPSGWIRKLRTIPGLTRDATQPRSIERQHHEHIVGHVPLAGDAVCARRHEAESRIEARMSDDDDEGAAGFLQSPVPFFDQPRANPLPLMFWHD